MRNIKTNIKYGLMLVAGCLGCSRRAAAEEAAAVADIASAQMGTQSLDEIHAMQDKTHALLDRFGAALQRLSGEGARPAPLAPREAPLQKPAQARAPRGARGAESRRGRRLRRGLRRIRRGVLSRFIAATLKRRGQLIVPALLSNVAYYPANPPGG